MHFCIPVFVCISIHKYSCMTINVSRDIFRIKSFSKGIIPMRKFIDVISLCSMHSINKAIKLVKANWMAAYLFTVSTFFVFCFSTIISILFKNSHILKNLKCQCYARHLPCFCFPTQVAQETFCGSWQIYLQCRQVCKSD